MKYIIKNCPCLFNSYYASGKTVRFECNDGNHDDKLCCDVIDCLLKQIVEKCKDYKEECNLSCIDNRMCFTCFLGGKKELAEDILDDLEIEEVNE